MPTLVQPKTEIIFHPAKLASALKKALSVLDKARTNAFLQVQFDLRSTHLTIRANSAKCRDEIKSEPWELVDLGITILADASRSLARGEAQHWALGAESARSLLKLIPTAKGVRSISLFVDMDAGRLTMGPLSVPLATEASPSPVLVEPGDYRPVAKAPAKAFAAALERVSHSRANGKGYPARRIISSVALEAALEGMMLVATDGMRLAMEEVICGEGLEEEVLDLLLPDGAVDLLPKILEGSEQVEVLRHRTCRSTCLLRADGVEFRFKETYGSYPKWRNVHKTAFGRQATFQRDEMVAALRLILAASGGATGKLRIDLRSQGWSLAVTGRDGAEVTGRINARGDVDPSGEGAHLYAGAFMEVVESFPKGAELRFDFDHFNPEVSLTGATCRFCSAAAPSYQVLVLAVRPGD